MEEEIVKLTKSFDCLKASGPYTLPSQIMRILPNQITPILKTIFNMPTDRKFPRLLKNVKVVPVFKNAVSSWIEYWVTISLYRCYLTSKFYWKASIRSCQVVFRLNDILFKHQFDFHSKHSTNHSVISVTEKVHRRWTKENFHVGFYLILKKRLTQFIMEFFSENYIIMK